MDGGPERAKMCLEKNSRDLKVEKVEKLELEQCLTAAGGVGGARV